MTAIIGIEVLRPDLRRGLARLGCLRRVPERPPRSRAHRENLAFPVAPVARYARAGLSPGDWTACRGTYPCGGWWRALAPHFRASSTSASLPPAFREGDRFAAGRFPSCVREPAGPRPNQGHSLMVHRGGASANLDRRAQPPDSATFRGFGRARGAVTANGDAHQVEEQGCTRSRRHHDTKRRGSLER
jgi:hypothetical protein